MSGKVESRRVGEGVRGVPGHLPVLEGPRRHRHLMRRRRLLSARGDHRLKQRPVGQVDADRPAEDGGHLPLGRRGQLVGPGDPRQRAAEPVQDLEPLLPLPGGLHLAAQPGGERPHEQGHGREHQQGDQVLRRLCTANV